MGGGGIPHHLKVAMYTKACSYEPNSTKVLKHQVSYKRPSVQRSLQPRPRPYSRSLREHNHSPPQPGLEPAPDSFRGYPHCGLQTPARNAWLTAKMSEKAKCYGKPLEKSYWIVDLKMIISYFTYRGLLW